MMEKKAKQGIMWYSADLASFLFKCAWKTLFLGFRAEILLLCAEILPLLRFVQKYYWPGTRGSLDSRAGPFLGSVKKYWFFGEIFTSGRGSLAGRCHASKLKFQKISETLWLFSIEPARQEGQGTLRGALWREEWTSMRKSPRLWCRSTPPSP